MMDVEKPSKDEKKPNSEHETDEDYKAFPGRVYERIHLCENRLKEFAAQPLSQFEPQWSKCLLAQEALGSIQSNL